LVRCILDSLAVAYARTVSSAEELAGQEADVVHIVGGGCQNQLLCQLTADLAGRPVHSGPVEATALGNLALQARAAGLLPEGLDELRLALRRGMQLVSYEPASARSSTEKAATR
jgi:rhamnulokinase